MTKRFLLLQGPCSPFFNVLGKNLLAAGQHVAKVNFNAGDARYWHLNSPWSYRDHASGLLTWYRKLFQREGYTDIVLFGDQRPVHRPAIALAETLGIRTHVFEEGYFRPYWVTLERGGVNAHSRLPKDPLWYRRIGPRIPDYGNGKSFPSPFTLRAWHDVAYHVAGLRNRFSYPGYRTHAPVPAHMEYRAYIRRALTIAVTKKNNLSAIQNLIYSRTPFWLLPLQLNSDSQIQHHSPFGHMKEMLEVTLLSFARMCRPDAVLVVKNHPLDSGLEDYPSELADICQRIGLPSRRIVYLESGPLPALLNHARGVVTVNSTVGGSALVHGRPLKALGAAIYDMPGLTYQGDLDSFWRHGKQPDKRLFQWFRNTVIHTTQINGGLYTNESIKMSAAAAVPRMLSDKSLLENLS